MAFKHFLVIILVFVSTSLTLSALDSHLDSGIKKYMLSDYSGAIDDFIKALDNPSTKSEAYLMLSLSTWRDRDIDKAFKYTRQFFEVSDNPEPYLSSLWVEFMISSDIASKGDDFVDFMQEIYDSEKISERMKINAIEYIRKYYDLLGDFRTADEYSSKINSIMKWQFVGDFENISGSGFEKYWEPIDHAEPDYIFHARTNAPVKWFELKNYRPGFWIRMNHHFYARDAVTFAQTFCTSPENIDAQIRVGTSGSLKVWVNDKLVISEQEERNNGVDTYIATIKLNKGNNRVLLQLGESELRGNCNFFARICDDNGKTLDNLTFSAEFAKYSAASDYGSRRIPNNTEIYFEQKIKGEPDKLLNYILLAHQYMQNDKTYEARKVINAGQKIAPNCSYLDWQLIQLYLRDENRTELSMVQEKIKGNDPDNPMSLNIFFNEAIENKNYEEAEKLLDKITAGKQKSLLSYSSRIKLASAKREVEKFNNLVDEAYSKFPYHTEFVVYKYFITKEIKKDPKKAAEYLEDYLDERYDNDIIEVLVSYLFSINKIDEGIDLLKSRIASDPTVPSFYQDIGRIYSGLSNYKEAINWFNKSREIAPYVGSYLASIGDAYKEMYQIDDAIKAYEECILYSPANFTVRDNLRILKKDEDPFSIAGKPDLYQKYLAAPDASEFPEDNSLLVYDESQVLVYKSGGYEEKHYELIKVFNSAGIDEWKEYYIPAYSNQDLTIEKAEVLKKDGNKLKAEVNDNYVVFTNLEEGDAILLIYKLDTYQYGSLINHFWDKTYFSTSWPIKESYYKLMIPPDKQFKYVMQNSEIKPTKTQIEGFDMYVWESHDVTALKHETLMPSYNDVLEVLNISTIPDWDFIAKWYDDLSRTKSKPDYEVKETLINLFPADENLSDKEKVKRIYDYIVDNIRYSSISFRQSGLIPQKASKVINTRVGDCKDVSTLMVSMCKEIGIDANLVLVDSRDNGQLDMPLPSIDFDHCIAKVNLNDKSYYVELTSDFNSFSTIYGSNKGALSLDIIGDTAIKSNAEYLDPPTRVPNIISRNSIVKFENENMFVEKNTLKMGGPAGNSRYVFRDVGEEQRRKSMQEAINNDYSNIKLLDLKFDENINNTDDSLTYFYSFRVNNVFSTIAGLYLFKLPWSEIQWPLDFLNHETRKYPVELWSYKGVDIENEEMSIEIPADMELVEIPEAVNFENGFAKYVMEYKLKGNVLNGKRIYEQKSDIVPPAKFKELKTFIEKIIKSDTKQIAFRKKKIK